VVHNYFDYIEETMETKPLEMKPHTFVVRVEVLDKLRKYAKETRQSMNRVVDFAIEEAIKRELRKKD